MAAQKLEIPKYTPAALKVLAPDTLRAYQQSPTMQ